MEVERSRKRRRYSGELKAQILAECAAPGASVAKVALSHGINANIVHGWRKQSRNGEAPAAMVRQELRLCGNSSNGPFSGSRHH